MRRSRRRRPTPPKTGNRYDRLILPPAICFRKNYHFGIKEGHIKVSDSPYPVVFTAKRLHNQSPGSPASGAPWVTGYPTILYREAVAQSAGQAWGKPRLYNRFAVKKPMDTVTQGALAKPRDPGL